MDGCIHTVRDAALFGSTGASGEADIGITALLGAGYAIVTAKARSN
jgi:hypothetical protein